MNIKDSINSVREKTFFVLDQDDSGVKILCNLSDAHERVFKVIHGTEMLYVGQKEDAAMLAYNDCCGRSKAMLEHGSGGAKGAPQSAPTTKPSDYGGNPGTSAEGTPQAQTHSYGDRSDPTGRESRSAETEDKSPLQLLFASPRFNEVKPTEMSEANFVENAALTYLDMLEWKSKKARILVDRNRDSIIVYNLR